MTKTSETRAPETRAPETTSGAPALFYHLTMSPPETLLTTQLTRAQAQGWRALLLVPSRDWAERFDIALWRGGPESFLAHGIAGGPQDADQPVLIRVAQQGEPVAGFEIVISLGAIAAGHYALYETSRSHKSGRGVAVAGLALGYMGLVVWILIGILRITNG